MTWVSALGGLLKFIDVAQWTSVWFSELRMAARAVLHLYSHKCHCSDWVRIWSAKILIVDALVLVLWPPAIFTGLIVRVVVRQHNKVLIAAYGSGSSHLYQPLSAYKTWMFRRHSICSPPQTRFQQFLMSTATLIDHASIDNESTTFNKGTINQQAELPKLTWYPCAPSGTQRYDLNRTVWVLCPSFLIMVLLRLLYS
jgi:hypothetical protein